MRLRRARTLLEHTRLPVEQVAEKIGTIPYELLTRLTSGIEQLATAAEEMSAVTEQTSAGVNSQKVETDQVATAMNEMAATVQEVARNAEEASEAALMADQQAREGDRVVGEAIAQIERLAAEVDHSSEAMSQLKAESDKIGSVLDVIKSVAQQTNLLALNAAIEAARAGEAGRGFAVVADEVRALAHRTQQSTEEIEQMIGGIRHDTDEAVTAMHSSNSLASATLDVARSAGEALEEITQSISQINERNLMIASASEQQAQVAREVDRNLIGIRDLSQQVLDGAVIEAALPTNQIESSAVTLVIRPEHAALTTTVGGTIAG